MGRRLNTSRPTVIQTMLTPLSDTFSVQANDTLEQWYYVNTGTYSPDRSLTPLLLTPTVSAVDPSTGILYHPNFSNVNWYYLNNSNGTWVKIEAVSSEDSEEGANDFYYDNEWRLHVQKNIAPATVGATDSGLSIRCVAQYIDPRDVSVVIEVQDIVLLATNKDATSTSLTINLLAPTKTIFNVLSSGSSLFDFTAQILDDSNKDVTNDYYIEWYGKENGENAEHLIDTLYCYTQATQQTYKGQGTDTITLDAMYTEHIDIVCKVKKKATSPDSQSTLPILPFVAYCSLVWEFPKVDATTVCSNGRAVDSTNRPMTFSTIINHRGGVVSDEQRITNFLLNYKKRVSTSENFTDLGWGDSISVTSDTLRQTVSYSTNVHSEVYMLGAFGAVMDNDEVVTDNNEVVFDRI